jgi:pimeloyl-ACP methyl ester carboxylesterase
VTRPHTLTGEPTDVLLTGDLLIEAIFGLFYVRDEIAGLPRLIQGVADSRSEALDSIADELLSVALDYEDLGEAMSLSVECYEEYPLNDQARVESEIRRLPVYGTIIGNDVMEVACAEWKIGTPPALENDPVHSEIATLVLAGEYDPVTPPGWARLAAGRLPNAYLFEFAGTTHDVLGTNGCANTLTTEFLDHPYVMPTATCLGESTTTVFLLPVTASGTERRDQRRTTGSD